MKTKLYMVDSNVLLESISQLGLSNREAALKAKLSPTTIGKLLNGSDLQPVKSKESTLKKLASLQNRDWSQFVSMKTEDVDKKMHLPNGEWNYSFCDGRFLGTGDISFKGGLIHFRSNCLDCRGKVVMWIGRYLMGDFHMTNMRGKRQGLFIARSMQDGSTTRIDMNLVFLERDRMKPIYVVATHANAI
ncbi:hypothetical protein SH501x_003218 [Pirellulaceae bacterium SH501]